MKKFFNALIAAALILGVSACGSNSSKNNDNQSSDNTSVSTSASDVSESSNSTLSSQNNTTVVSDTDKNSQSEVAELPNNYKPDKNTSETNNTMSKNEFSSKSSSSQIIKESAPALSSNTTNQNNQSENYNTEEEKQNRALQRQSINISELESELNSQFSQIDIGIDIWQLKIEIDKNDSNFFSQDIWIQTSYSTSLFTPYDLKYSIDITNEQKNKAISALKDLQYEVYHYVHSKYQYLKIKGGFYNGFYKYPNLHVGYDAIRFCSWTNYGQDNCFTGAYDHYGITDFGWDTTCDDYKW